MLVPVFAHQPDPPAAEIVGADEVVGDQPAIHERELPGRDQLALKERRLELPRVDAQPALVVGEPDVRVPDDVAARELGLHHRARDAEARIQVHARGRHGQVPRPGAALVRARAGEHPTADRDLQSACFCLRGRPRRRGCNEKEKRGRGDEPIPP